MTVETKHICPRCGGFIPNNFQPGEYPGAISRLDNKTEICSSCGTDEAMEDYMDGFVKDWRK
jgi:ribosomal protein S27AE